MQLPDLIIMEFDIASLCAYHTRTSSLQNSLNNLLQWLTPLLSNDSQSIHELVKRDPALTLHLQPRRKVVDCIKLVRPDLNHS